MVDLDKQFAEMADVSEEDTAYDFVIDEDLRVIAVPERGVVLGVEGDKDVNRVRFRMNRYYRGTDLSDFNIRINYRPAEGEINYFPVTEKTVQDEKISFVWLVGADAVATKGTVYFIARFFTAEENGDIVQEFNTTLGNARTLEGLAVDAQAEDKPVKDLLAQLEYDLKTYTAPFVQQAKTYAENSAQSADHSAISARNAATYAGAAGTSAQNAEASAGKAEKAQKKTQELANEVGVKVTTDPSLSVPGAPADAEATGKRFKTVDSALSDRYTKEETDELLKNVDPFPVGSIFQTVSLASPASMFGGIWEEIAQERTLMGASDIHAAGSMAEAGLPNITGFIYNISGWVSSDNKKEDEVASGAFKYKKGEYSSWNFEGTTSYSHRAHKTDFDASLSNAIYGASSTVQPPAYFVHIWERMGYLLNIYAEVGSSLTITDGVTTVEDVMDASGRYSRELPNTGTWTVTAVKNGFTEAETFKVSSYGVFTADLAIKTFGVVWDYNARSTTLTRLTKATDPNGFVTTDITTEPVAAVGATGGRSPFDSYMPWSGMEEYNIVSGAVGVKRGDQGFSRANDTVVLVPEFYYKVVDDATNKKRYFYISDKVGSGFDKHPGSGRYVGKYKTGEGYVSKTGIAALGSLTRATARTGSIGKGSGWYQYDYAVYCAIILLYIVEYADWDSQAKIGQGIVSNSSSTITTGKTDSMTYHTGRASGTDGSTAVQYRHIEDLWGTVCTFVDGINFNGGTVYICTDFSKYADDTATGYTKIGTRATSTGYIKTLGFSAAAPWAIYPSAVGGSETTYIPDYLWADASNWTLPLTGGFTSSGTKAGLFYMDCFYSSRAESYSGSRLMYIPQN